MASTLQHQVNRTLSGKSKIGESRHQAKKELREEKGKDYKFTDSIDSIHSIKTMEMYKEHCTRFVNWCVKEKGISKYTSLEKVKPLVREYLQEREERGLSLYTLKAEKSALGKLYGEQIDYKFKNNRGQQEITRSRGEKEFDKHFSEERNKDLVNICKGTGGRREDIAKLTKENFIQDEKGKLWVEFKQSKGGKDRLAPVLPGYEKAIKEFLDTKEDKEKLFDKVHAACDVHGYRREYARELYEICKEDKEQRDYFAKMYPQRYEPGISGDTYHSRGEKEFHGKRDDIYIVSQALGHNRLEVSVNHYLK